jgi:hypothetical protein
MEGDKDALLKALNASARELRKSIDTHCALVASVSDEQLDEQDLRPLGELCPSKSREHTLKEAIKEAINVIEDSRKAFKSKQLEMLRKRLTQVLIDTD